jgi:hypothetical protein
MVKNYRRLCCKTTALGAEELAKPAVKTKNSFVIYADKNFLNTNSSKPLKH